MHRTSSKLFCISNILILLLNSRCSVSDNPYPQTQISSSECYDGYGQPRVRIISQFFNSQSQVSRADNDEIWNFTLKLFWMLIISTMLFFVVSLIPFSSLKMHFFFLHWYLWNFFSSLCLTAQKNSNFDWSRNTQAHASN
jgi:hypothetical protein